ncbi:putative oxidoreductase C terminal-domain-containing protein [Trametes meyenii]|nr:putative oxidoreductase C terminal-domain-containing protein [Trametes meyenii]
MSGPVNILLVGAGEINFGSVEGPWNHVRYYRILGPRLRVVALVDIDVSRAQAAIDAKLRSPAAEAYAQCKAFPTVVDAARFLLSVKPQVAIVGAPPFARGTDIVGRDLELQLVEAFPTCALFVEKPVSSGSEDACWRVADVLAKKHALVGVGYMLRYLKGRCSLLTDGLRDIIRDNGLVVMGTNARYIMAYEWARKFAWWDKTRSGGPIIEQATHFCDLSRYFGGDVHLPSVVAHTVLYDERPGVLSAKQFDEDLIPPANRLPRLTSATWKYDDGAVGTLTHVIALHGNTYDTEFEVYADGYRFKLVDPYGTPKLSIRRPGINEEEIHTFTNDDPFYTELASFLDVVEGRRLGKDKIMSSYEDAIKTYELTWAIRRASEAAAVGYTQRTAV